jgi:threonine/homoserine/homoserine lactone efflux protein
VSALAHPAAAFGLGIALGTSPGPVQLLLLSESSRGGVGRGLRAMAGANGTFGLFLAALALGLASLDPGEAFLRVVRVIGGGFLLILAFDALNGRRRPPSTEVSGPSLHPTARGVMAVVLNPGAYVFLATTATALLADASADGGRTLAVGTAVALLAGVSVIDSSIVLLGAGAHRLSERRLRVLTAVFGLALGAIGAWLVVRGVLG